jgi:hypothetical protein
VGGDVAATDRCTEGRLLAAFVFDDADFRLTLRDAARLHGDLRMCDCRSLWSRERCPLTPSFTEVVRPPEEARAALAGRIASERLLLLHRAGVPFYGLPQVAEFVGFGVGAGRARLMATQGL